MNRGRTPCHVKIKDSAPAAISAAKNTAAAAPVLQPIENGAIFLLPLYPRTNCRNGAKSPENSATGSSLNITQAGGPYMEQDLTQGSISKVLLRFVLPFLGASILQFLYSVVDMMIVGQFADAAAISAVNTSGQIMQLITGLISGIATGGTVLIGQHVGAKRYPSVSSVAQALLALCLGLGVLLTAVFLAGNHFIISIMQVPAAAVLPAQDYLRITSLGILFIAGYNGISAILRGLGGFQTPHVFCGLLLYPQYFWRFAAGWRISNGRRRRRTGNHAFTSSCLYSGAAVSPSRNVAVPVFLQSSEGTACDHGAGAPPWHSSGCTGCAGESLLRHDYGHCQPHGADPIRRSGRGRAHYWLWYADSHCFSLGAVCIYSAKCGCRRAGANEIRSEALGFALSRRNRSIYRSD